jgi:hypothetical protein
MDATSTSRIVIDAGLHRFDAKLETANAPRTCAAFRQRLPLQGKLLQARWSGEACWVPLGDLDLGVPLENPIREPSPGMVLFHPADVSESEILVPYGTTRFASKHGPLQGTHFLTVTDLPGLASLGQEVLMHGVQDVVFRAAPPGRLAQR